MNTPTPTIIPAAPQGDRNAWEQLAEALAPVLARKLHDPNIIFCRPDFRHPNRSISCPIPPELFAHTELKKSCKKLPIFLDFWFSSQQRKTLKINEEERKKKLKKAGHCSELCYTLKGDKRLIVNRLNNNERHPDNKPLPTDPQLGCMEQR